MARTRIDIKRFRVPPGGKLSLADYDPTDTSPFESREGTRKLLAKRVHRLFELADLLYAQSRWSVLFVFQAMDGAGKDSVIKHVLRGLDPKATQVYSFKTPSTEELKHDFMWRCLKSLPERGRIGIFNRSYYEEVLVSRVHPELLKQRQLPACCVTPHIWKERYEDIRSIERYLTRNGTVIRKIYLNVSKAEQRRRFLMRLHNPDKRWKFSLNDVNERLRWKEYMAAYEDTLKAYTRARMRIASANYDLDKARCAGLTGNDKDVCQEQAKARLVAAQADAKADQKTIEARNEAREDKLSAAYRVALEKCDAFAGAAKDQCVSAAKAEFGK